MRDRGWLTIFMAVLVFLGNSCGDDNPTSPQGFVLLGTWDGYMQFADDRGGASGDSVVCRLVFEAQADTVGGLLMFYDEDTTFVFTLVNVAHEGSSVHFAIDESESSVDPPELWNFAGALSASDKMDGTFASEGTVSEQGTWSVLRRAGADTAPPAAIDDLARLAATDSSITLTWRAPGDDDLLGQASRYDIRYSREMLTLETWTTADSVASPPTPGIAGAVEICTVMNLAAGTPYYFGVKTADTVPNWSALSNVLLATTGTRLSAPSAPDSLLLNIRALYNDKGRRVAERVARYADLFLPVGSQPGFVFNFQPADIHNGLPPSWGLNEEIEAHRGLFTAQDNGEIFLLELGMTYGSTYPIENDPEHVGWQAIFVSNVYLRLMFNPNDGLEVNGGQAEFLFPPAVEDRWYIGEWTDLPRPGPLAVEPATWGAIKATFR